MLLSFSVCNFRCFSDEITLDPLSRRLKTRTPRAPEGWADHVEPVAAIYGPNAAGKSTVLEAMYALAHCIREPGSGRIWQRNAESGPDDPTKFEVGFVGADGIRYEYKVVCARGGIMFEQLASYPKSSRRILFTRRPGDQGALQVVKGNSLAGPTQEVARITKPTMLFLAVARKYGHQVLRPIAETLLAKTGVELLTLDEVTDVGLVQRVIMEIIESDAQRDLVRHLLKAADVGIDRISVREEELPEEVRRIVADRLALEREGGEEVDEVEIPRLVSVAEFWHRGGDGREFSLPLPAQSSGTLTWLRTAWYALNALRRGSVLLVDELDASLHPDLVRVLVDWFQSANLNTRGAQLIFTTHDVSLLGNSPTRLLTPQQVWFVQKGEDGQAELFSQDDFDNRSGNNTERRYLAGAFGALPVVDDRLVREFLELGRGKV